jgi:hypothetical protein
MNNIREKLIVPVALCVMACWVAALIAGMFTQNFTPFEIATPVMILLAGYTFGVQIVRSNVEKDKG